MQAESRFVQANDGTRLHVRLHRCSRAVTPTCVMIHGFGEGGYVWEDTCAALRERCSTAVVDLRGHGDSEASRSGRYDLQTNVSDIATIVKEMALARTIVVGHSLGGEIGVRLAAHRLSTVAAAILVDVSPDMNQDVARRATDYVRQTLRTYPLREDYCSLLMSVRPLLSEHTARQLALGALRKTQGGFQLKLDPALIEHADEEFTSLADWQQLLPTVDCPTLIVRGAGSAMVTPQSVQQMLRLMPRAQFVSVPRAGHAVMSDNPSAFCAAVVGFLNAMFPIETALTTAAVSTRLGESSQ